MFARFLVLCLLLCPVGSMVGPYEFEPDRAMVTDGNRLVVFSVYNSNYGYVRFNLTVVNLGDELEFLDLDWGYFDAEVYDMDGVFLGYAREEDAEDYLLFFAPGGRHVRTWMWDKSVTLDGVRTRLEPGGYQVVGVYRGVETVKTEMFEFHFSDSFRSRKEYISDEVLAAREKRKDAMFRIEKGFLWASYGVLVMGFFEDRLVVWLRGWTGWGLDWGGNRTVLWMATVVLSILMLGLTGASGLVYDLFWV